MEISEKRFNGQKDAKLGTLKNPAIVHVQNKKRLKEVEAIFKKHEWEYKIELNPEKPENIADLEILMNPPQTIVAEAKTGRNDPCTCGSGKKYKSCCGK